MSNDSNDIELKNEKKKKVPKLAIVCLVFSIILISAGAYLTYLSNPRKIMSTAVDNFTMNIKNITGTNGDLDLGQTYTLTSAIKLNITSDMFSSLQQDPANAQYINIINNINNTDNKLILSQDFTNKKLFVNWNTKLGTQDIIAAKYLVENSTEYYTVKDYLDNYVNNGNSNYFEALTKEQDQAKNMEYIYEITVASLKEHLKEEYFVKKQDTTSINGKETKLTKVSLELNNDVLKEIASNVLSDLKNDSKANKILTSYDEDFSKIKIDDSTKFLEEQEYIYVNIYTDNLTYEIKKYEFISKDKEDETKLVYEVETQEAYLIENNKTIYTFKITTGSNKYKVEINDSAKSTKIGQVEYDKTPKRTTLALSFEEEETKIDFDYDLKLNDIKANTSYKSDATVSVKISSQGANILTVNLTSNNEMINTSNITEDISNSVLASSITPEQNQALLQNYMLITTQRMSQ